MRYAIGDIHGCLTELRQLLEEKLRISEGDEIYFVGDLVTKGSDNLGVVEYLQSLKSQGFNISAVMGNHEWRITHLFYSDFKMLEWYLEEYNCSDLLNGELDEIMSYLGGLPYFIDTGDFLIIHSELGSSENYGQSDARFLFGESHFESLYSSGELENKIQVYGHRARKLEDIVFDSMTIPKRIGIDGGCVYPDYGYLCSLNLDTILIDKVKRVFHN